MKKLLAFVLLLGMLLLVSCQDLSNIASDIKPITYAPEVTEEESQFIQMIKDLKPSVISIENKIEKITETETRRGTGFIIKKSKTGLLNTYLAVTAKWVVEDSLKVSILYAQGQTTDATVINPLIITNEINDLAIISFQTDINLEVIELEKLTDPKSIDTNKVFSIGTPISNYFYNSVSNVANIMGINQNIIIHGSNINYGMIGSPLFLKSTGKLIGINLFYSQTSGNRPEVLINRALHINQLYDLIEGYL